MKPMPKGDYYEWYCDWCDSLNLSLWTRLMEEEVACGACLRANPLPEPPNYPQRRVMAGPENF